MPAYPDTEQLTARAVTGLLNHFSSAMTAMLRSGTMTEEQLDQVVGIIKENASSGVPLQLTTTKMGD